MAATASVHHLDAETLERWTKYLSGWPKQHPILDEWKSLVQSNSEMEEVERFATSVKEKVLHVIAEKKTD